VELIWFDPPQAILQIDTRTNVVGNDRNPLSNVGSRTTGSDVDHSMFFIELHNSSGRILNDKTMARVRRRRTAFLGKRFATRIDNDLTGYRIANDGCYDPSTALI